VGEEDVASLRDNGWSDAAIWEITALASFFNFSGRMEAVSGLPPDEIPAEASFAEARGG
jgi:alkylhydroperoxidase family enzyme